MKKSKEYMSEESFNLLVESLNQAIEYERGERDDLRVTVVPAPPKTVGAEMSIREKVTQEIAGLSEAKLYKVADFLAFLNFQEGINSRRPLDNGRIADAPSLEDLLAGVTEQNLHREVGYGLAIGKELW